MAQSQAIFDCCGGNPLLLLPLPEGDNAFALLPSCTRDWDETLAPHLVERPRRKKRCHCVALSSLSREALIRLNVFVPQSAATVDLQKQT